MIAFAVAILCLAGLPSQPAFAGESFADKIEGTYESADRNEKARRRINKQIDKVVGEMFFIKRPFARSELEEATEPCDRIEIDSGDGEITIVCDDRKPTTTKPDGTTERWTSRDDETYRLSQSVEDDRIVQVFENDDGKRTNTYRLDGEDKLVLDVKIESDSLPMPLTYTRKFDRT